MLVATECEQRCWINMFSFARTTKKASESVKAFEIDVAAIHPIEEGSRLNPDLELDDDL